MNDFLHQCLNFHWLESADNCLKFQWFLVMIWIDQVKPYYLMISIFSSAVPNPEYIWGYLYSYYCKLRLVTPHGGDEGSKIFNFDNPRLLEKALSGKELHRKLLLLTKKY